MPQLGAAGPDRPRQQSLPCWSEASIRSSEEQDRSRHHSAHRGGLELSTGTELYGAFRSTQCCLAVCSRWMESSTRLGGFRALKKTTEAPCTTKVNYCTPLVVNYPLSHSDDPPIDHFRCEPHSTFTTHIYLVRCIRNTDYSLYRTALLNV